MKDLTTAKLIQKIDKAIDKNKTILKLKTQQGQQGRELRRFSDELHRQSLRIDKLSDELHRQSLRIDKLSDELHRQGIILEELNDNMRAVAEAVMPLLKKSADMQEFDETRKTPCDKIKITQKVLRDHINDKKVHNLDSELSD